MSQRLHNCISVQTNGRCLISEDVYVRMGRPKLMKVVSRVEDNVLIFRPVFIDGEDVHVVSGTGTGNSPFVAVPAHFYALGRQLPKGAVHFTPVCYTHNRWGIDVSRLAFLSDDLTSDAET